MYAYCIVRNKLKEKILYLYRGCHENKRTSQRISSRKSILLWLQSQMFLFLLFHASTTCGTIVNKSVQNMITKDPINIKWSSFVKNEEHNNLHYCEFNITAPEVPVIHFLLPCTRLTSLM